MEQVTVVVDFGTSHTVVVVSGPGLPARLVSVDGEPWFPSAVFWGRDGRGVVGRDALRLGRAEPARLERRPKARLGEEEVLLGDAVVPTTTLVRHVLVRAIAEAGATADAVVAHLVLTHPADWGPARLGALLTAAQGLVPRVSTVVEPVAAAAWFATERQLPIDAMLAVLDFGGGTCDVALVRRETTGLTVAACAGLPDLGGDDLDQRIVDHLASGRAELARLTDGEQVGRVPAAELAELSRFRDDVRGAKEALSRHPQADLVLPADLPDTLLTREEFEHQIRPDLARAVELLDSTTRSAGLTGADLAAVQLVGGSSRVPLLAQLLRAWADVPVRLDEQPEAVVALGAAVAIRPPSAPRAPDRTGRDPDPTGPVRIIERAPVTGPTRARWPVIAVAVVVLVALAVLIGVRGLGETVAGSARPAPGAGPRLSLPPATPGDPVAVPGRSTAGLQEVGPGEFVSYVHQRTTLQWRLDSFDDGAEVNLSLRRLGNELAPDHHWALVRYTVRATEALAADPGLNGKLHLVDDRGLMLSPVDAATGPLTNTTASLPEDCPPPVTEPVAAGSELPACALYSVSDATPITEVALAYHANRSPLPSLSEETATRGARVAVDGAEPAENPPAPWDDTHPAGEPVEMPIGRVPAEIAVVDLVADGSAYFEEDTTIILAGSTAMVLRVAVRPAEPAAVGDLSTVSVALLDDRGAPIDSSVPLNTNECVNTFADEEISGTVALCVLFAVPTDATPSAAVVRSGFDVASEAWHLR